MVGRAILEATDMMCGTGSGNWKFENDSDGADVISHFCAHRLVNASGPAPAHPYITETFSAYIHVICTTKLVDLSN